MLAVAATMTARRRSQLRAALDSGRAPRTRGQQEAGSAPRAVGASRLHGGWHPLLVAAAAAGVGLITGFFGAGGGFVVPALVLTLGFDMSAAAGTSLVVIAIDSAAALAARAGHGGLALDRALIGAFATAAVAGALAGGRRLADRASLQRLSAAFTALSVIVADYTLARSLGAAA
jgi:uncharacterized membrane protein YfcA